MQYRKYIQIVKLLGIAPISAFLFACGGGDSSGPNVSIGTSPNGGVVSAGSATVGFNLRDAVTLMTSDQILDSTTTLAGAFTGELPTFSVSQTWTSRPAGLMSSMGPLAAAAAGSTMTGSSNLIAVDANGKATLAVTGNSPVKVLYSAVDPSGVYVYIALSADQGNGNAQPNFNFQQTIANLNCALFKVRISDNNSVCVSEGKLLPPIDDYYRQTMSSEIRPIQFDKLGNMYFAAISFTRVCPNNSNCYANFTNDWMSTQVYKYSSSGVLTQVSQDNESPTYFAVLPNGDVVFSSLQQTKGSMNSKLSMLRTSGQNILLASDMGWWGQNFITTDTSNAVMWTSNNYSGGANDGIHFARPSPTSLTGGNWAMLKTNLFASNNANNGYSSPTPRRLLVSDNGSLYGVFEGNRSYQDSSGSWKFESSLRVNQVLPYDPIPKLVLKLPSNGWWDWMRKVSFVTANGFLLYSENGDLGDGAGARDMIRMVRLSDRKVISALDTANDPYQIYNWRLSGNVLNFSGLKSSSNQVILGTIDTLLLSQGRPQSEYLKVTSLASAKNASIIVKDMTIVKASPPADGTGAPSLLSINVDPENLYSGTLNFSKYMDQSNINANVTLRKSSDSSEVTYFPLWIYKSLHMIPVGAGLSYSTRDRDTYLDYGTAYTVNISSNLKDTVGGAIAASNRPFTTRPVSGWYKSSAGLTGSIDNDDYIAKWAQGKDTSGNWTYTTNDYLISNNVPVNFRFEFSARNSNWNGLGIYLASTPNAGTSRRLIQADLGNWSSVSVITSAQSASSRTRDVSQSSTTNTIFTGEWTKYRLDVWGSNLRLSSCKTNCSVAGNWDRFPSIFDLNMVTASRTAGFLSLYMTLTQSMDFGSFKIQQLNATGADPSLSGAAAVLDDELASLTLPTWLTTAISPGSVIPQW